MGRADAWAARRAGPLRPRRKELLLMGSPGPAGRRRILPARDAAGNVDASPTVKRFRIMKR